VGTPKPPTIDELWDILAEHQALHAADLEKLAQAEAERDHALRALAMAVPQGEIGTVNCPWSELDDCPFADDWTYDPEEESEEDARCRHEYDDNAPCWVAYYLALATQEAPMSKPETLKQVVETITPEALSLENLRVLLVSVQAGVGDSQVKPIWLRAVAAVEQALAERGAAEVLAEKLIRHLGSTHPFAAGSLTVDGLVKQATAEAQRRREAGA